MNQEHFNNLLRNAVIAALPLASTVGCSAAESKPEPETIKKPEIVKKVDPCRAGEKTTVTGQEQFNAQIKLQEKPLTTDQCLSLCKSEFVKRKIGSFQSPLVELKSFSASDCKTTNRSFSSPNFFGKPTRSAVEALRNTPSTLVSCSVNYTAIHSPYTCPRVVPGRMPNGLQPHNDPARTHSSVNIVGQYLADMAVMETAAITAFDYLKRELDAYNAPAELIARAEKAILEEMRHAEMATLLAASFDTTTPEVSVDDFALRSLYEIALENAVEGCVNETFAAACGLWQSEKAELDVFRKVIAHITDEEMGHAALSWEIHQWIMPQLTQAEQEKIRQAQVTAVDNLMSEFKQESNTVLQKTFGLPSKDDAKQLFAQLKNSVWEMVSQPSSRNALVQG